MRVWVAYVTYENNLGSYVLGVRTDLEECKLLAKAHRDQHVASDPDAVPILEWSPFRDQQTHGFQSINESLALTYYVEPTELNYELDSSIDRRVLELEKRVGKLAEAVESQVSMWKPLEDRQIVLEGYIDHLLDRLVASGTITEEEAKSYTFPGGETWSKGEQV